MRDPKMLNRISDKLPPEEMAKWMMRYIDEHPDREFARSVTREVLFFPYVTNPAYRWKTDW